VVVDGRRGRPRLRRRHPDTGFIIAGTGSEREGELVAGISGYGRDGTETASDQELAGDSLYEFIVHHATTHYVNTGARGGLERWRAAGPRAFARWSLGSIRLTTPS